jgi:hypothetical protein
MPKQTERERLITSLLIDFYFNRCVGIKTETLEKCLELIKQDLQVEPAGNLQDICKKGCKQCKNGQ